MRYVNIEMKHQYYPSLLQSEVTVTSHLVREIWTSKPGLMKAFVKGDLFNNGILMSFEDLRQRYDIQTKHFFKHLQIRSYISKIQKSLSLPALTSVEEITVKIDSKRGLI